MPPAKQPLSIESILAQQRLEKEQQSKVRSSPRCATRSSHSPNPCTRTAKVPLKAREAGPRAPETRARSRSRKGTRTRGETQTRPTRTHSPRFALCRRRRRRRRRRRTAFPATAVPSRRRRARPVCRLPGRRSQRPQLRLAPGRLPTERTRSRWRLRRRTGARSRQGRTRLPRWRSTSWSAFQRSQWAARKRTRGTRSPRPRCS